VLQLGHVLFGSPFLREIPGQHELGFEHGPGCLNPAIQGGRHPAVHGMKHLPLHLNHHLSGVLLVPMSVQLLGHAAELDQEIAGQILRLDLAALLPPQPQQRRLVVAYDGPGIRTANEGAALMYENASL